MGNGINKIIPGLYIGNFRDAKNVEQLKENNIDHIVALYDNPSPVLKDITYKCVDVSDSVNQDISKHFYECIKFIHKARTSGSGVLVHCIAGVSRSSTIVAAYLIVVTKIGWQDAIIAMQKCRSVVNPNYGFQRQLEEFELKRASEVRNKLSKKHNIDPADEIYILEVLSSASESNQLGDPAEAKLHTQTFRHYRDQRIKDSNGQIKKTNEDIKELFT